MIFSLPKVSKEYIDSTIERAKSLNGLVEVTDPNGYRFHITPSEFMELMDCKDRDRRRIATRILRSAKLKYANEYPGDTPDSAYRKIPHSGMVLRFSSMIGNYSFSIPKRVYVYGISMEKREGNKHIPSKEQKRKEATILDRLKAHWMDASTHSKKEKLFGFEVEFASEIKTVEKVIKYREGMCGIEGCCPGIGPELERVEKIKQQPPDFKQIEQLIPGVKMKHDGSVYPCAGRIAEATLLSGPNGYLRLKKLCSEIRERGGFVNHTCSVHVHLDARDNDKRVVGIRASKLWDAIDILKELVPDSRIKFCQCSLRDTEHKGFNHYCKLKKPGFDGDRYTAINLDAYNKYRTIEVRLGGASLNASKIWHWANLLLEVSNSKKRYTSWNEFLTSDFPLYLRIWAVNRANELRPNETLRKQRMDMISPNLDTVLKSQYEEEKDIE